jgi:hypothetical protein
MRESHKTRKTDVTVPRPQCREDRGDHTELSKQALRLSAHDRTMLQNPNSFQAKSFILILEDFHKWRYIRIH